MVIVMMTCAALTRGFSYNTSISNKSKLFAIVGAIFFLISDTILAINKFNSPIKYGKTYVMITYYLGQTFIGASAWSNVIASCSYCSGLSNCHCYLNNSSKKDKEN